MTEIDFKRITPEESRIYCGGDIVGEVRETKHNH